MIDSGIAAQPLTADVVAAWLKSLEAVVDVAREDIKTKKSIMDAQHHEILALRAEIERLRAAMQGGDIGGT